MNTVLVLAGVVWREMLRKKDLYVVSLLLAALTLMLLTVDTFGTENVSRYLLDLGLLLIWMLSIMLAVTFAARQIPEEEKRGTIFPLLAKPVSRMQLIVGKWLGCWTASVCATAAFLAFLLAVIYLRGGEVDGSALLQCGLLYAVLLGIITAVTLTLSTRMTYGAAATTSFVLQAAVFMLVPRIPVMVGYEHGLRRSALMIIYYLLPHYELFDMRRRLVHGWGTVPWSVFGLIVLYGMVLTALFLLLAWAAYRRKLFKRGEAM